MWQRVTAASRACTSSSARAPGPCRSPRLSCRPSPPQDESRRRPCPDDGRFLRPCWGRSSSPSRRCVPDRSEEHTSELQSRRDLVCRLLLEKKKKKQFRTTQL